MPSVRANGIQIEYDTFGDRAAEPMLLIMGLGSQMLFWHEDFCRMLAERGHYVVRFDNRDIGLSTKFAEAGVPNILEVMTASLQGLPVQVPYTLDDMADDAAGLLDALDLPRAHVVGASMGGMIAQTVAIRHPQRVKSLVSIMSSTGDPGLPQGKPEVLMLLLQPTPTDREGAIARSVNIFRAIGSPGFPFEEDMVRDRAARCFDRCHNPEGQVRQLAAIFAHGSRRAALGRLNVPTLVIHGSGDPLVPLEGGMDTAAAIPGAELMIVDGMGHDNPRPLWPGAVDAIARLTQRAAAESRAA